MPRQAKSAKNWISLLVEVVSGETPGNQIQLQREYGRFEPGLGARCAPGPQDIGSLAGDVGCVPFFIAVPVLGSWCSYRGCAHRKDLAIFRRVRSKTGPKNGVSRS